MKEPKIREINNMDHVLINNIKEYNQLNDAIDNKIKFDSNSSLGNIPMKETQPIVTISIIGGKNLEIPLLLV